MRAKRPTARTASASVASGALGTAMSLAYQPQAR